MKRHTAWPALVALLGLTGCAGLADGSAAPALATATAGATGTTFTVPSMRMTWTPDVTPPPALGSAAVSRGVRITLADPVPDGDAALVLRASMTNTGTEPVGVSVVPELLCRQPGGGTGPAPGTTLVNLGAVAPGASVERTVRVGRATVRSCTGSTVVEAILTYTSEDVSLSSLTWSVPEAVVRQTG
ncbi:hypothetical protein ACWDRR_21660 [Kitasatospora sp. NPDC003701]